MAEIVDRLTHIVCDEANAFDARHPELSDPARSMGMLAWGLLRAVAACPECPGIFRLPQADWQRLVCPQCHGVWVYEDPPAPRPTKPRRRTATRKEPAP